VNKVLEQLQTFIDPFKPQLVDVLEAILDQIDMESSPFAGIQGRLSVRNKLSQLYCSITGHNYEALAKDGVMAVLGDESTQNAAVAALSGEVSASLEDTKTRLAEAAQLLKSGIAAAGEESKARLADAARLREAGDSAAGIKFRQPSEPEIVALLSSFWSSIR
jgi:hypothetical protein